MTHPVRKPARAWDEDAARVTARRTRVQPGLPAAARASAWRAAFALTLALYGGTAVAQQHDHGTAGQSQTSADARPSEADAHIARHPLTPGARLPGIAPEREVASAADGQASADATGTSRTGAPSPAPASDAASDSAQDAAFPALHGMRMQDHMDDDPVLATLRLDRLEWQDGREGAGLGWELQGWLGDLENRVWLRSEGEQREGRIEHGDVELLWGRPTGPWWDLLLGVRHDLGVGPTRDWLAIGVQGLAPYKFEVAATAYLGEGGRAALRAEAEYEVLLTNRLVLQPRIEANAYTRDDAASGVGSGLSDARLGLRLRYEVTRRLAPYAGYEWSRSFGRTADLAGTRGEPRSDRQWIAGVRVWF